MEKAVHAALVTRTDDYLDWSEPYRNCDLFNRSNSPFAEFRSKNFVSPFELTFTNWLRARCARTSCLNSSLRVIETLSLSRHSPPLFSLGFLTKFRRKPRPSSSVPFELHKTSLSLFLSLSVLFIAKLKLVSNTRSYTYTPIQSSQRRSKTVRKEISEVF